MVLLFDIMFEWREFQREGATYLKDRWPNRFVLEFLGPGASKRDPDAANTAGGQKCCPTLTIVGLSSSSFMFQVHFKQNMG